MTEDYSLYLPLPKSITMMINSNTKLQEYLRPLAEELSFSPEGVVCESPLPGGNEGIGYEDWPKY